MPLDSLDPMSRVELKKIIRTQTRAFLSRENNFSNLPDKLPSMSENIINALDQLPAEIRQEFLQTWLSSQLALDPSTIMPLLEILQNSENTQIQKQIIAAAAFLKRQNLPLRQFFLRPLADLTAVSEQTAAADKDITADFNISLAALMEQINSLLQQGDREKAGIFFRTLPGELDQLLENLFHMTDISDQDRSLDTGGLKPGENQLLSSLLGIKLLNLAEEAGDRGNLRLYLEWPPLPFEKVSERFILRVSSRKKKREDQQDQEDGEIYNLNFIIKLPSLGKVRADVQVQRLNIRLDFTVTNQDTEELLAEKYQLLEKRLSNAGFDVKEPAINLEEDIREDVLKREIMKGKLPLESSEDISRLLDKYQHIDFRA